MRRLFFLVVTLIGIFFITQSCDKKWVFEDYAEIENNTWLKDSLIKFDFVVSDTVKYHNLYINIRNTVDYQYRNLWLFVSVKPPGGEVLTDTLDFPITDPSGKWLGSGMGKVRDNRFFYRRNVYFPQSGEYQVTIQQGMRTGELEGINAIGFRVESIE